MEDIDLTTDYDVGVTDDAYITSLDDITTDTNIDVSTDADYEDGLVSSPLKAQWKRRT